MTEKSVWGRTRAQRAIERNEEPPVRERAPRMSLYEVSLSQRRRSPNGTRKAYSPTEAWARHLRRVYGIDTAEYDRLLNAQGGVCAICGRPERYSGGRDGTASLRLAVDHDHKSGKVRGLLCMSCNSAIGALDDDPDLLKRAIDYLTRTNVETPWEMPK